MDMGGKKHPSRPLQGDDMLRNAAVSCPQLEQKSIQINPRPTRRIRVDRVKKPVETQLLKGLSSLSGWPGARLEVCCSMKL
jgi:hypothetical protein